MGRKKRGNGAPHDGLLIDWGTGYAMVHPNYQIFNAIGADASGVLFRGKSTKDDRIVAIKLFTEEAKPAPLARRGDTLRFPNLIDAVDILSGKNGVPLAVMEMPGGACLEKVVSKKGKMPVATAVHIALNVSIIVREIHGHNEVHGHVNSHNVFLKRQPNMRIAVQLLHYKLTGRPSSFNLLSFLSPELVCESDVVQPSDDNWAIAVLLYQMIFGESPFTGNSREETISRIRSGEFTLAPAFAQHFASIASFFRRTLCTEKHERLSDEAAIQTLRSILSELDNKPDAVIPDEAPPVEGAVDETAIPQIQSVTADPFWDEELKDTRPEKVIQNWDDARRDSSDRAMGQSTGDSSIIPEDMKDTSPGVYVVDDALDSTNASEFLPISGGDLMAPSTEGMGPSFSASTVENHQEQENAIVYAEPEKIESDWRPNISIQPVYGRSRRAGQEKRSPRTRWLLTLSAAIAVVGMLATVIFIPRSAHQNPSPDHDSGKNELMKSPAPNPSVVASPAKESSPDAGEGNGVPTPAENVVITLKGLPSNARVTVNGLPAAHPLQVPKSDDPVAIQAAIGNQIIFTETLVPATNLTLIVADAANIGQPHHPKKKIDPNKSSRTPSSKKSKGSLSSNPYQLKKNPFASRAKD